MKKSILSSFRITFLLALILGAASSSSYASHVFGVDIYYTWVSGNTYTVHMTIYGDCQAQAYIFNTLYTATPEVEVYNDNVSTTNPYTTINLNPGSPQGTEVTPVCPAQASNTACNGGTLPGVRKFTYSLNVTLNATSSHWRFHFDGAMGAGSSAGRATTITSILGGTTVALDATLNNSSTNTTGHNSSVTYTTIATPFFCMNKPASFNPGAVDPDGDSLSFALVAGMNNNGAPVTYTTNITPPFTYSATNPVGVAAANPLVFSSSTGQMNFTPTFQQRSLVVYTVSEYRNGVLVGTSQREMTFVVLSNCNTSPPIGVVSNPVGGGVSIIDSTHISACQSQGSFSFQINPTDSSNANITVTSAGLPSGATFTVTNNASPTPHGTFSWNTTGVAPGAYTFFLTLQDDNCPLSSKQTVAYTITILPIPTNVFSLITPATCIKKAVFTITPGLGSPFQIKIFQGATTLISLNNITAPHTDSLVPGTYVIRVTNTNSCYKDTTVTIAPPPVIIPSVALTSPLCPGGSTGSITLTATGGLAPFTYAIGIGTYSTMNVFSNLSSATYTVHVKDANSCIKDTTVFLPDATPILTFFNIKNPTCNHYTNGYINVTAYNTYSPYTYAIGAGPFGSTNTFNNLATGPYLIHIKDGHNCPKDTTITLVDSLAIQATFNLTNILCHSDSTGSIVVNASGGFGPAYTYALNAGAAVSTNSFGTLPAASYVVHIKDDSLCFLDTTIALTQPAALAINPTITNVQCYGTPTGQIVAVTTGGVTPYQFNINGGVYGTSNTFSSLTPGTYIVHVTDNNNCLKADTVAITSPAKLLITSVVQANATCNGQANGSLTVTATGGVTPYSYTVNANPYGSSNIVGSLAAGTYTLHVKDANGCIRDSATFTITQPTPIVPSVQLTNSTCHTLANGQVIVSATGGTTSYTFAVGAGAYSTSGTFSPLAAATYTFHVKDANGCVKDTIITVIDSLNIIGTATITPASCYGLNNGVINMVGSGGSSPYGYALGAGSYSSVNTFSNNLAGTYTIHIKDNNGCIKDTNVVVAQPALIVPAIAIVSPTCHGFSDGTATVTVTGGTPGFNFAIGTGSYAAAASFPGLPAGTDTVWVKDNNGCIRDTVFSITQPSSLIIDSLTLSNIKCNGDNSGWVEVYASGAIPPYTYASNASGFQSANMLTGLYVGSQVIHIKDNHNCPLDSTVKLTQPAHLAFVLDSLLEPTCEGFTDGYVKYHAIGGTPTYLYSMSDSINFSNKSTFAAIPEGTYKFYIKDANNCVYDTTLPFIGYQHIVVQDVSLRSPSCYGFSNGNITLTVTGQQPLLFQLQSGMAFTDAFTFDSIISKTYNIVIQDSKGCLKDTAIVLTQPDSLHIAAGLTPNDCIGIDDGGGINLTVSGGTTPYKYSWSSNPETNSATVKGMPNGYYMAWVHDANNCVDSLLSTISYDDCCKPFVPDAFTPNGDGKNDLFRIRFKGDIKLENFSIYNRFGQRVYYSIYVDQGWDGTYNGVPQELGTYDYYIKAFCGNKLDHEISLHGNVTLIR